VRLSPVLPPMVPRMPEIDLINATNAGLNLDRMQR
jgi:hypothetical protein